jgi:hypothetical protein
MCRQLGGCQVAAEVRPPRSLYVGAPVAEAPGRNAVAVEDIPARVVAAPSIRGEAMELAVRLDALRRDQPGGLHSLDELVDPIAGAHRHPPVGYDRLVVAAVTISRGAPRPLPGPGFSSQATGLDLGRWGLCPLGHSPAFQRAGRLSLLMGFPWRNDRGWRRALLATPPLLRYQPGYYLALQLCGALGFPRFCDSARPPSAIRPKRHRRRESPLANPPPNRNAAHVIASR